jgi:mannosyl-oligosaccharide alpha-1,2-mannosidase
MSSFRRLFLALAASAVSAELVQKPGLQLPDSAASQREAVKDLFVTSYEAYQYVLFIFISTCTHRIPCRTYAWGHDDLLPVSETYFDGRNGWGASIADAMGTMVSKQTSH